jgi:hypothetical protein
MEQQEFAFMTAGNAKWRSHFRRQLGKLLLKSNVGLSNKTVVAPLSVVQTDLKTYPKTCMQVFIASLGIVVKKRKQ